MKRESFVVVDSSGRKFRVYWHTHRQRWYVQWREGGKWLRRSLDADSKPEAENAVRRLWKPVEEQPSRPAIEELSWRKFAEDYLEYKTQQGKAPRSVARFKAAMDAFGRYLQHQGIVAVDRISLTVLEGYKAYRTKTEECREKTAYNDALVLKNAFKWGSKPARAILKVNPALDWETPEPDTPKRRCYTREEVVRLETEVRPWLRPVLTALAWSGMRIGELVNLRWKDVDFEKRVMHIRIREDWKPKGRADRVIPLHSKVEAALRLQRVGEYAFTGPQGGRLKESWCLHCLKKDQVKLGLAEGDLHGFRRFFATSMMRAGVDVETVRQWGGWKSLETMLRYLADVNVKDSVNAMQQAEAKLAAS
jgi:integrase